jgi:photosystem I P700 chlorophyll a apoprotein A1
MAISSTDRRAKNVQILLKDAVETSFEKWAQPGHFSRTLAKVRKQLLGFGTYADAHDFDSQTSSLEEVSRKIFSAHFGQLQLYSYGLVVCTSMEHISLTIQLG